MKGHSETIKALLLPSIGGIGGALGACPYPGASPPTDKIFSISCTFWKILQNRVLKPLQTSWCPSYVGLQIRPYTVWVSVFILILTVLIVGANVGMVDLNIWPHMELIHGVSMGRLVNILEDYHTK